MRITQVEVGKHYLVKHGRDDHPHLRGIRRVMKVIEVNKTAPSRVTAHYPEPVCVDSHTGQSVTLGAPGAIVTVVYTNKTVTAANVLREATPEEIDRYNHHQRGEFTQRNGVWESVPNLVLAKAS